MTLDMTNNRAPYGLLTVEEKAALHEHEKAGGMIEAWFDVKGWYAATNATFSDWVYRTVPLPKTQDVIAWDRLPDWVEWVARDADFEVLGHSLDPDISCDSTWWGHGERRRIDDFPGIVLEVGTCDWRESKQRRPK
jgi:hypothetical protein